MNTIIEIRADKRTKGPDLSFRRIDFQGTRLLVNPGSLHKHGEVYLYGNGNLHAFSYTEGHEVVSRQTDLILPRGLEDELRLLAKPGWDVYLIRVPALGFGNVRIVISSNLVPMLVPTDDPLEGNVGRKKQKHVSKSTAST